MLLRRFLEAALSLLPYSAFFAAYGIFLVAAISAAPQAEKKAIDEAVTKDIGSQDEQKISSILALLANNDGLGLRHELFGTHDN